MAVNNEVGSPDGAAILTDLGDESHSELSITGLIKQTGDPTVVHLALPPHADRWIAIPESSVAAADPIGAIELDDVSHTLVRLHLRRPDSPEAVVFHDLLAAVRTSAEADLRHRLADAGVDTVAAAYCYYDASGRWICG